MIVTVTMNPCVDTSTHTASVVPEHKLRCGQPLHDPGGGGINVSRVVQRLGGKTIALYPSGGLNGERLQRFIAKEGIDQRPVPINGLTRENFTVYEESSHHQYRFTFPGEPLNEGDVESIFYHLERINPRPDYVVASGSLPPKTSDDFYARLSVQVSKWSCRLIIDTSGPALLKAVEKGCYLIKPNLREMGMLAGKDITNESEIAEVANAIIRKGNCEVIVVSLGAGGVLLVTKQGVERIASPTVPIKSKVGAGDSMVAGICFYLDEGQSVRDAVNFGVAAGSAAVMTPGTDLCRKEDVLALYEFIKTRSAG